MTMKYYRPNQRKRTVIVPTRRFFIIIGIAAAVVVAIILLVTLSSGDGDKETEDAQAGNTVPALEQSQEVPSVVSEHSVVMDDKEDEPETTATPDDTAQTPEGEGVDPQLPASPQEYKQLGLESEGDEVKKLQEKLIELGYLDAKATGYYGTVTYDAVYDFQKANSLDADGIAGAKTQTVLFSGTAKAAD